MSPQEAIGRWKCVRQELSRLSDQTVRLGGWLAVVAKRLQTQPDHHVENAQSPVVFRTAGWVHLLVDTDAEVVPMPHPSADDIASLLNTVMALRKAVQKLDEPLA